LVALSGRRRSGVPASAGQHRELRELALAEHAGRRKARARLGDAADRTKPERRHESLELDEARLERPLVVARQANADDHGSFLLHHFFAGSGRASSENSSIVWWSTFENRDTSIDLLASMNCAPCRSVYRTRLPGIGVR